MRPSKNPLIGKYFHSMDSSGQVEWQGVVVGSPEPGLYLVQLFEWMMGEPNLMRLVWSQHMVRWLFYSSSQLMKDSYEHGAAREGGPYRRKAVSPKLAVDLDRGRKLFEQMKKKAGIE